MPETGAFEQLLNLSADLGPFIGLQHGTGSAQHLAERCGDAVRGRRVKHFLHLARGAAVRVALEGGGDTLPCAQIVGTRRRAGLPMWARIQPAFRRRRQEPTCRSGPLGELDPRCRPAARAFCLGWLWLGCLGLGWPRLWRGRTADRLPAGRPSERSLRPRQQLVSSRLLEHRHRHRQAALSDLGPVGLFGVVVII